MILARAITVYVLPGRVIGSYACSTRYRNLICTFYVLKSFLFSRILKITLQSSVLQGVSGKTQHFVFLSEFIYYLWTIKWFSINECTRISASVWHQPRLNAVLMDLEITLFVRVPRKAFGADLTAGKKNNRKYCWQHL